MDIATLAIFIVLGIIIFLLACAAIYLFYAFTAKIEIINAMKEEHKKLMRSFNDLDDQAKMIVRTDLELNKIHEEMDKRLNGLNARKLQMCVLLNGGGREIRTPVSEGTHRFPSGTQDARVYFPKWRRVRESNPINLSVVLISSQVHYRPAHSP